MADLDQEVREEVYDKYGAECKFCGVTREAYERSKGSELHLHHVIPRDQNGSDTTQNLIPLCKSCHGTLEEFTKRWTNCTVPREPLVMDYSVKEALENVQEGDRVLVSEKQNPLTVKQVNREENPSTTVDRRSQVLLRTERGTPFRAIHEEFSNSVDSVDIGGEEFCGTTTRTKLEQVNGSSSYGEIEQFDILRPWHE